MPRLEDGTRDSGKTGRVEWLDHAKGVCIILVVMLYATENAAARGKAETANSGA